MALPEAVAGSVPILREPVVNVQAPCAPRTECANRTVTDTRLPLSCQDVVVAWSARVVVLDGVLGPLGAAVGRVVGRLAGVGDVWVVGSAGAGVVGVVGVVGAGVLGVVGVVGVVGVEAGGELGAGLVVVSVPVALGVLVSNVHQDGAFGEMSARFWVYGACP